MIYDRQKALALLRVGSKLSGAQFRDGQEEAIVDLLDGPGRILVVQRTGWGKSFVYFIAAKLLRDEGYGPALLVSPLLALMRNQISAAQCMGVRAMTVNSANRDDWADVEVAIVKDEVDVLIISPERFANEEFQNEILSRIADRVSLLVVDEAHCISDWGHDFRPDYRRLERIVKNLPRNLRILATTATANNRVIADLSEVLGPDLKLSRGNLDRNSLKLQTMRLPKQEERLAWLAQNLRDLSGHGIIYTSTVRDAHSLEDWLKLKGYNVHAYTGQTGDSREQLEQALLGNTVKALVATSALGMGFDKPDLAFVIHYQAPSSVIAYYQQIGRAGRALPSAFCVLLGGEEDRTISEYFIDSAFPSRAEVESVITALEETSDGASVKELLERLNIRKGRIQKVLDLLALENPAPVVKQGAKWQLTTATLKETFWLRAKRLTDLRRAELDQMQQYVDLEHGHMNFLLKALDSDTSAASFSVEPSFSSEIDPSLIREAIAFLKRSNIAIEPRKSWASGREREFRGGIPVRHQAQAGRALSIWSDAGWGWLVRRGKYQDGCFADELVEGCKSLVLEWSPNPFPTWVTCIPSLRYPDLVPDFARRLAAALTLPFRQVLIKTQRRPEQKRMANSVQQAKNIQGSLGIEGQILSGSVLLIDDVVDSRWTFTFAAWLLRKNGAGEVWPLALADSGHR